MTSQRIESGWLCGTPMVEVTRRPDRTRWCFSCREHLPHDLVVLDTVEPSYYEPIVRLDCPKCHKDRTVGFGGVRVWDSE